MIHHCLSFIVHETLSLEIRLALMSPFSSPSFIANAKREAAQMAEVEFLGKKCSSVLCSFAPSCHSEPMPNAGHCQEKSKLKRITYKMS